MESGLTTHQLSEELDQQRGSRQRLGYRWLNSDRSWMFGVNAGYDSRPMSTGQADTGIAVTNSRTVFFQQVAAGLEAVSNT